jgi:hypothetical protein
LLQQSDPQVVVLKDIVMAEGLEFFTKVVCEIFDYDNHGSSEFMGRFTAVPLIRTEVMPASLALK